MIVHISFIWMSVNQSEWPTKAGHNRKEACYLGMTVWITDPMRWKGSAKVYSKGPSTQTNDSHMPWTAQIQVNCGLNVPVSSRYRHGNSEDRLFPQFYKCTAGLFHRLSAVCDLRTQLVSCHTQYIKHQLLVPCILSYTSKLTVWQFSIRFNRGATYCCCWLEVFCLKG